MLSDLELIEIYRYLLEKLREIADNSVILDVESAAATRIEENITENNGIMMGFSREARKELDPLRLRAPTPREAFTAAVGVLITRLREVPALVDKLTERLSYQASEIQWKPDVSERLAF